MVPIQERAGVIAARSGMLSLAGTIHDGVDGIMESNAAFPFTDMHDHGLFGVLPLIAQSIA